MRQHLKACIASILAVLCLPEPAHAICTSRDWNCSTTAPAATPVGSQPGVLWLLLGGVGVGVLAGGPGLGLYYGCGPGSSCAGTPQDVGIALITVGAIGLFVSGITLVVILSSQASANQAMLAPHRTLGYSLDGPPPLGGGLGAPVFTF